MELKGALGNFPKITLISQGGGGSVPSSLLENFGGGSGVVT